jgi:hypothetical protein
MSIPQASIVWQELFIAQQSLYVLVILVRAFQMLTAMPGRRKPEDVREVLWQGHQKCGEIFAFSY